MEPNHHQDNEHLIIQKIGYIVIIIIIITLVSYILIKKYYHPKPKEIATTNAPTETPSPTPTKEKISEYNVPILMYHYIREYSDQNDEVGMNLSVSPKKFEEQMKWLKDNNYQTVDMEYLTNPYKVDFKPIIITFDDGYTDAYKNAFSILKKFDFIGVFYVIVNDIEKTEYLTWDMMKEMQKDQMKFGSHTLTHPDLRNASDKDLKKQLKSSKEELEKELNTTIVDLCYPAGKYDDKTIEKVEEIGYKTAVTTKAGIADQDSDLFKLPRQRVQNNSNISNLVQ